SLMLSNLNISPYGSKPGSCRKPKISSPKKVSESKENPSTSKEIEGFMVAGAGFEPTTFGL
ncbi:MAG: hypothetical protein K2P08_00690, partial [Oscillospiraceae bacterium]|nr:hypothetical protein [Oscillospiraceae bacterium]